MLGKYGEDLNRQMEKNEKIVALAKHLEKNKVAGEKTLTIEELGDMDPEQLAKSFGKRNSLMSRKPSSKTNDDGESQDKEKNKKENKKPQRSKVETDPRMNHPHVKGGGTLFM